MKAGMRPLGSRVAGSFALMTVLALPGCRARMAADPVDQDGPLVALHVGSLEERAGLKPVRFHGKSLYVDPEAVITDEEIERIEVSRSDDGIVLDVLLSSAGTGRLRSSTAENLGAPMAITFQSRVVAAPIIRVPIESGRIQVGVPAESEEEIEGIIEAVRARWPAL